MNWPMFRRVERRACGGLALRLLPKHPEHRLGREVEQPDGWSRDTRESRHQWRDGTGDALRSARFLGTSSPMISDKYVIAKNTPA